MLYRSGMVVLEPTMTRAFCLRSLAAVLFAALLAMPAAAQRRAPRVEAGVALSFGAIVASTRPGQVTITPDGDVQCAGLQCLGGARAGDFYVSGPRDFAVAVTVAPAVLRASGGSTMSVRIIPSTTSLLLRPGQRQNRFMVGGTLSIGANQPTGDYRGDYLVVLDYL